MSRQFGLIAVLLILTLAAGTIGGWLGVRQGLAQAGRRQSLDERLHRDLHLSASQQGKIHDLETAFAPRRRALESEMRAANVDLARALVAEHAYGPAAERAIGRFHAAMGELQRETVVHVMAMRRVLTPDQATRFDATVSRSLASDLP